MQGAGESILPIGSDRATVLVNQVLQVGGAVFQELGLEQGKSWRGDTNSPARWRRPHGASHCGRARNCRGDCGAAKSERPPRRPDFRIWRQLFWDLPKY